MLQINRLSRRLLLIDGDGLKGESPALAVIRDFFRDSIGGGWQDDEIESLPGPCLSKTSLASHFSALTPVNYCVVIYTGRVAHIKADRPWKETHLVLPNGESVSERDVNTGSPRMLFIFDGGGNGSAETEQKNKDCGPKSATGITRRAAYDKALLAAEEGVVKLSYFSAEDVPSTDFSLSSAIVSTARAWAETQAGVLCLDRTLEQMRLNGESAQSIEYNPGRRLRHFPLAVS